VIKTGLHVQSLEDLRLAASCLTIGAFDGIHLGHRKLLAALVEAAGQQGLPAVVLTFHPHPSVVLHGQRPPFYLSSPDERAALLAQLGIDAVVTQPFDERLSRVPAAEFLQWLVDRLAPRALWVGPDFALGYERHGDIPFLMGQAGSSGYQLHVVEPLLVAGEVVSSSRIRQLVQAGDVRQAAQLLGRWFALPGQVEQGAGRGRQLGIPTANLKVWPERAHPANGVYVCLAQVGADRFQAVANIGVRPTFDRAASSPIVEAHLLDFDGDLYGRTISLMLVERLRDERKFEGVEALLAQIRRDIVQARQVLSTVS